MSDFAQRLIAWQKRHGRNDLPWQQSSDPYSIWVSEVMLQQTQVSTAIPYYQRFMARFPDVASLAGAPLDSVLALWSGLGYYSRARNLHLAARSIVERHGGEFPRNIEQIMALPGIGRSTAAAIAAFAFSQTAAILDGNVKRVLSRVFAVEGYPGEKRVESRLWQHAEALLPEREIARYTQALMDLGATCCTLRNPDCAACPVGDVCIALASGRTGELPHPKPRKKLPVKAARFLILSWEGKLLFERRADKGVWQGLLCFPQLEPGVDPRSLAAGCEIGKIAQLADFEHVFSHYKLIITPLSIELRSPPGESGLWLDREQALAAPIPLPVRKILQQF